MNRSVEDTHDIAPGVGGNGHEAHSHEHREQRLQQRRARGLEPQEDESPAEFWERLYSNEARVWSGRVNASLQRAVQGFTPGSAFDLGCGEGGDVLWLAREGWDAVGIDLSETAIARAREHAGGIPNARFVAGDLSEWARDPSRIDGASQPFDLVTASFLQSPVHLPREHVLRAAAARVNVGGHLVLTSHAAPPSWAPDHGGDFFSPDQELATLNLDPASWVVEVAEIWQREITAPDGSPATLDDSVVVVRRQAPEG